MSHGAVYEITERIISALRGSLDVRAIFGAQVRIYEDVKPDATFPYISVASPQDIPHFAEGLDLSELYIAFDVWARDGGTEEANTGLSAIREVLHLATPFETDSYSVFTLVHKMTNGPFRDPDGLTWHGQITFRAQVQALNTTL